MLWVWKLGVYWVYLSSEVNFYMSGMFKNVFDVFGLFVCWLWIFVFFVEDVFFISDELIGVVSGIGELGECVFGFGSVE